MFVLSIRKAANQMEVDTITKTRRTPDRLAHQTTPLQALCNGPHSKPGRLEEPNFAAIYAAHPPYKRQHIDRDQRDAKQLRETHIGYRLSERMGARDNKTPAMHDMLSPASAEICWNPSS
jgi:hypothetical protein